MSSNRWGRKQCQKKSKTSHLDEPGIEGDEWVEYGSGVEIGRVRYLGQGMERKAWVADLSLPRRSDWPSGAYVVLLPEAEVGPDFNIRVRREAAVLARLSRLKLPFALPRIIDWGEVSLGDPAYDLAIVTRGTRRPFKLADGLGRLVAAYQAAGGEVTQAQIHLHELCLAGQ